MLNRLTFLEESKY